MNKKVSIYLTLFSLLLILFSETISKQFYLNFSSSMPKGVYQIVEGEVAKGDLVVFDVPENYKSYQFLNPNKKLLKEVYAIAGERYCIGDDGIRVNGNFLAASKFKDFTGRVINKKFGCFNVTEGHYLPLALYHDHSFDGRYFGEVSVESSKKVQIKIYL